MENLSTLNKRYDTIKLLERIEVNPNIMLGKSVIRGTRTTVETILRKLSQGVLVDEILRDYPHLKNEDIRAALEYAATSVSMEEVVPFAGSTV